MPHTDKATAVARETGWNLNEDASERGWTAVGLGPVGRHRDSEALDRSNFECVIVPMQDQFGEAVDIARFGHWAVGWVEEIIWDAGRADIAEYVADTHARLDDYPVIDEMHWGQLEDEENHPGDGYCYSDQPEYCGCELNPA